MSVRYTIVLDNNRKIDRSDICFGAMNCFPWSSGMVDTTLGSNTLSTREVCASMTTADMKMLQYFPAPNWKPAYWSKKNEPTRDYPGGLTAGERKKLSYTNYFSAMKDIVADMPMLQDVVTVHPLLKLTRSHIKNHKADKVILSMFLMRNLAQYDYAHTYNMLRQEGYRPRVAAIFSQVFQFQKSSGLGPDVVRGYSQSESSWIRVETFGETAAIRLLQQDKDACNDLYVQIPWVEQSCGYKRDSHLRDSSNVFQRGLGGGLSYKSLNSCFCIPGDKPLAWKQDNGSILTEQQQEENLLGHHGFFASYFLHMSVSGTKAELLTLIDNICVKAGIEAKLND